MKVKKQMLKALAYNTIRDRIIRFQLKPGQDINEAMIADELEVSRTPVREALLQLAQEGFVEMFPHKGIFVSHIDYQDIFDLYKMRLFFEIPAIEALCATLDDTRRKELLQLREYYATYTYSNRAEIYEVWMQKDSQLHMIFINAYGNKQFTDLYKIIETRCSRIRYLLARNEPSRTSLGSLEHVRIIDYVLVNDPKNAVDELIKHVGVNTIIHDVLDEISGYKAQRML